MDDDTNPRYGKYGEDLQLIASVAKQRLEKLSHQLWSDKVEWEEALETIKKNKASEEKLNKAAASIRKLEGQWGTDTKLMDSYRELRKHYFSLPEEEYLPYPPNRWSNSVDSLAPIVQGVATTVTTSAALMPLYYTWALGGYR